MIERGSRRGDDDLACVVQAFKPPESKNAATTMVIMGIMAMSLFVGITYLSTHMSLIPEETESILSQMTRAITGGNFLYYWVQFFTAGILFLAANTAYQDFPRLSAFLSNDGFMPRWMQMRGTRLVFSSGIVVLSIVASLIVLVFQADEIAMLPLYALGVMLSFSISQSGMFRLMGRIAHLKPGQSLRTLEAGSECHWDDFDFYRVRHFDEHKISGGSLDRSCDHSAPGCHVPFNSRSL